MSEETQHPSPPTQPEAAASGSVTPETDRQSFNVCPSGNHISRPYGICCPSSFARKLERERDEAINLARRAMKMLDLAEDAEISEWPDTSAIDNLVAEIAAILPQNATSAAAGSERKETNGN